MTKPAARRPLEQLGGRKYVVTVAGLVLVPLLTMLGAPSEAFIALASIVLSFCGGNAAVSWKHGSKP